MGERREMGSTQSKGEGKGGWVRKRGEGEERREEGEGRQRM